MAVFAIAIVKDEADIVEHTVRHMLSQVDHVLIADNRSTDGTREILEGLGLDVLDDPEVGYFQSAKMTRLAARAAARGAEWIVPFDADEFWYSPFGRIAEVLAARPTATTAPAEVYDHVPTAHDPAAASPLSSVGWRRREPCPLEKVACRAALPVTIEQGNHAATYPSYRLDGELVVRHFPYRSAEQFVRKARNGAAAYAATDLPETQGAHWRQYGQILDQDGPEALEGVFRQWFWSPDPAADQTLIYDPCPL